ncbi:MAG TPA: hypothetical protein VHR66_18415 [Gemmataceae bacterium]|jgi:phenylacetate-coenzyme A ligase PaaK-like adenylate-forming protein|nr:hypothetical protein [Gemmataceae bacterium]
MHLTKERFSSDEFLDLVSSSPNEALRPALSLSGLDAEAFSLVCLADTITYARSQCIRYSTVCPPKLEAFSQLESLPILTRREIDEDISPICVRGEKVCRYSTTSATTTGHSLFVPHSSPEDEAVSRYHRLVFGFTGTKNLILRLVPCGRSIGGGSGIAGREFLAAFDSNAARETTADNWDYIIAQLFGQFPGPEGNQRIGSIHATPPFGLIALTKFMKARGVDPRETGVHSLLVTGSWIGKHSRSMLEQFWNARVHTNFSCSELNGTAAECQIHKGRYHFSHLVYPEVVDRYSHRPVPVGGEGRLVLTGVYPFHRACIFLRYAVGDWARWLGSVACECGREARTIEHLGRERDVLAVENSDGVTLFLSSPAILNTLDQFDWIPKIPLPQFRWNLHHTGKKALIHIDVECYTICGPIWKKRSEEAIAVALLAELPHLKAEADSGAIAIDVQLRPRGHLTHDVRIP